MGDPSTGEGDIDGAHGRREGMGWGLQGVPEIEWDGKVMLRRRMK